MPASIGLATSAPMVGAPPGAATSGAATTDPRPARSSDYRADAATKDADLRAIDRKVRAHEQAHAAVGGQYTGAPRYEYERGENGVLYAVAGEVSIDTAVIPGDPDATLEKMRIVIAAALAPVDPSPTDRQVAAEARQQAQQAAQELASADRSEGGSGTGLLLNAVA